MTSWMFRGRLPALRPCSLGSGGLAVSAAAITCCVLALVIWLAQPTPPPALPMLMLEGRTYVVLSHRQQDEAAMPVLLLRDERTGHLEWRLAAIQVQVADGVVLADVLTHLPIQSSVRMGPREYQLRIQPVDFSRVHRALLTDWRVLRMDMPLAVRNAGFPLAASQPHASSQ